MTEERVWRVMTTTASKVCQHVVERSGIWAVRQHWIFAWLRAVRILWRYFALRGYKNPFTTIDNKDYYNFLCVAAVSIACKAENECTQTNLWDIASLIKCPWTDAMLEQLVTFERMLLALMEYRFLASPTAACYWAEPERIEHLAKWLQFEVMVDPSILDLPAQEQAWRAEMTVRAWRASFAL